MSHWLVAFWQKNGQRLLKKMKSERLKGIEKAIQNSRLNATDGLAHASAIHDKTINEIVHSSATQLHFWKFKTRRFNSYYLLDPSIMTLGIY